MIYDPPSPRAMIIETNNALAVIPRSTTVRIRLFQDFYALLDDLQGNAGARRDGLGCHVDQAVAIAQHDHLLERDDGLPVAVEGAVVHRREQLSVHLRTPTLSR